MKPEMENAIGNADIDFFICLLAEAPHDVQLEAIEGIGRIGNNKARLVLISTVRDRYGRKPEIRIAALKCVGDLMSFERYTSLLEEHITGDNKKVVKTAREILKVLDPDGYVTRLILYGCTDFAAIKAYGTGGDNSAVPLLVGFLDSLFEKGDLLKTRYWGRAYAAVRALGFLGGPDSLIALQSLEKRFLHMSSERDRAFSEDRGRKIKEAFRVSIVRAGKE